MAKVKGIQSLTKRALIDKSNSRTVIFAGVAAFIVMFALVSGRSMISQAAYNNRVIDAKKATLKTLDENLEARDDLVNSYKGFVGTSQNVIGGSTTGTGDRDGDNAKIVLDALPSKYDFPALTSSIEKLASAQGVTIESMSGIDDEVAQGEQSSSVTPEPVPMVFDFSINAGYPQIQALVSSFERSIRPMQVQLLSISGSDGDLTTAVTAQTFYQPEKTLKLREKVLK